MAAWTYIPTFQFKPERMVPKTLINQWSHGGSSRRQLHGTLRYRLREHYEASRTEADAMLDFFDLRLLVVSFTKIHYDPIGGANWNTGE